MDIFLVEKLQDIFLHSEQKKKSSPKVKDHYISSVPKKYTFCNNGIAGPIGFSETSSKKNIKKKETQTIIIA